MSLTIHLDESQQGSAKLLLDGSLDSETAPELESKLATIKDDTQIIVFDMKHLRFISSAGLRIVFSTLKKQKAKGGKVAISNMNAGVKKVFEIVKALPDFSVFANTKELDSYLAQFQ